MKMTSATKRTATKQPSTGIDAIETSATGAMASRGDLLVGSDETFGIALVYAYGTFEELNALHEKMYGVKPKLAESNGYCLNGILRSGDCSGILVWVNSDIPKNQCFPTLVHEISHLADDILSNARAEDRSGETRAYIIEREIARVFPAMFGLKCHAALDVDKVKKLLK